MFPSRFSEDIAWADYYGFIFVDTLVSSKLMFPHVCVLLYLYRLEHEAEWAVPPQRTSALVKDLIVLLSSEHILKFRQLPWLTHGHCCLSELPTISA